MFVHRALKEHMHLHAFVITAHLNVQSAQAVQFVNRAIHPMS